MNNTSNSSSGGVGFIGLLTVVFITLKLCGVITWPWLWVLSPIWITTAVVLAVTVAAFLLIQYLEKRETPEQRAAKACRRLADAIRKQE